MYNLKCIPYMDISKSEEVLLKKMRKYYGTQ